MMFVAFMVQCAANQQAKPLSPELRAVSRAVEGASVGHGPKWLLALRAGWGPTGPDAYVDPVITPLGVISYSSYVS